MSQFFSAHFVLMSQFAFNVYSRTTEIILSTRTQNIILNDNRLPVSYALSNIINKNLLNIN